MARLCTPGSPKTCRTLSARSASTIHSPPVRSSAEVMVGSPADICGKGAQRCWERMAPRAGLEPATPRLTAGCSTIELSGNTVSGPARPLFVSQVSPTRLQPADIDAVLGARGVDHVDRGEARFAEHAARRLLTPGRAEPRAAGGQRDRHAMQHAHAVDVRCERVADIILELARSLRLHHEIDTARRKRASHPTQHAGRVPRS